MSALSHDQGMLEAIYILNHAYKSFLQYILEQWWVNLDWMVLAELNGLGRTNPNIQKCMGTMKQVFQLATIADPMLQSSSCFPGVSASKISGCGSCTRVTSPFFSSMSKRNLVSAKAEHWMCYQSNLISLQLCRHFIDLIVRHFESWFPVCFAALAWYRGQMDLNIAKLPAPSIHLNLARIHTCKSLATATCQCFAALPLQKMWNFHEKEWSIKYRNNINIISTNWLQDSEMATFMYCNPCRQVETHPGQSAFVPSATQHRSHLQTYRIVALAEKRNEQMLQNRKKGSKTFEPSQATNKNYKRCLRLISIDWVLY